MGKCLMPQVFVIGGGDEGVGEGNYLVTFRDYDGTVLKQKRVNSGGSVTAPTAPTHNGLTFQEWTYSTTNVTSNMNVGATYITSDGKTLLYLRVTVATGKDVVLYLNKSDTSTMSIDWGDGSAVSTFTNSGSFNTGTKTYADYGDYSVKIWISSGAGTYGLGNGGTTTTVVGGDTQAQRNMLRYAFIGSSVTSISDYAFSSCRTLTNITIPNGVASIGASAFSSCYSLTNITIPYSVQSIGNYAFQYCYSLTNIVIPNGVSSIGTYAFNACFSLTNITLPNSVSNIGTNTFTNCYSLTNITLPSGVTSIDANAFYQCYSLTTYVIERTAGVVTLSATNALTGINTSTKIYVPDELVASYKTATNWSTYADYIYPLSEKGVTHDD